MAENCRCLPPLVALLLLHAAVSAQRFNGREMDSSVCTCKMNLSVWDFPIQKFKTLETQVQQCVTSLEDQNAKVGIRESKIKEATMTLQNLSNHLQQFEKVNHEGLYNPLNFRLLEYEVNELGSKLQEVQKGKQLSEAFQQELNEEIQDIQEKVTNLHSYDKSNLLYFREKVRKINNRLQSCTTFDTQHAHCFSRVLSNISEPLVAEVNHQGTSYPFGAWGKDSMIGSPEKYWMLVLISSHVYVNYMRVYPTFSNFVKKTGYSDLSITSSHTTTNSIMGPGAILYNNSLYYNCYRTGDICKYNLAARSVVSASIPGAGFNDKFPYCYYSCYTYTDIDFSADEKGLWVIYATEANYGNIVVSKLDSETLQITQTWNTRIFKRAVTNAFMVCGMLYATRLVSADIEEVFYMFDTETNTELNSLKVPFTKVGARISNAHYNTNDKRLYVFNEGYMIAYELYF